jgi:isocitrate dehydrogenase
MGDPDMNSITPAQVLLEATADLLETPATTAVTVARGDGIGPEIMDACLSIMDAAGARLAVESIDIGESVYLAGETSGIGAAAWDSLRRTGVFYKAPISTPSGGGYKSLNVTVRKTLGLFANVRPCVAYAPFVHTLHPGMDVVIIRENEEDLYAGIEHRQTDEVFQCLKLITLPGCERIVRYAFEYARLHGRRRVTCFTKDNIMKLTDGLFHKVFDETAKEYPDIVADHMIVDIGAARLAAKPELFDVIVTSNLYGDIVSDIAAEVAGSVGMAPSFNIGPHGAMFEAVHGSAPNLAGRDVANPSGLLLAGVMMLSHIGQGKIAERIHNAWLKTVEDGVRTADMHGAASVSGTRAFARAVIDRLGEVPEKLRAVAYPDKGVETAISAEIERVRPARKQIVGVDVFVHRAGITPEKLAFSLQSAVDQGGAPLKLAMITNRGVKVWPDGLPETFLTDHWRCRFMGRPGEGVSKTTIIALLSRLDLFGVDFIKTEHLCTFDDKPGFTLGQGQ